MLRESKIITVNDKEISVKVLGFYQITLLVNLFINLGENLGISNTGLNKGQYCNKVMKEFNTYSEDDLTGAFSDNTVVTLIEQLFNECYIDIDFKELTFEAVFELLTTLINLINNK